MPLPNLSNLPILKKNLPLIIAGISALLAVVLINLYIRQQAEQERKRLQEMQSKMVNVVIAAKDIARGAQITEEMLTEKPASRDKVPPTVATSAARVLNKFAMVAIAKGEPIFLNKLAEPERRDRWQPLSARIPPGKRAVTITVDEIASVAGMVQPGDSVDLVGMVSLPSAAATGQMTTLPLFQNVLVLAVGQDTNPAPPKAGQDKAQSTATLALSPQEANIVAFIAEQGKIRLVLRSPADKQSARSAPADWDTVLRFIFPREEARPSRTVEIYHGLKKETKSLEQ